MAEGEIELPSWLSPEDLEKATRRPAIDMEAKVRHPDIGKTRSLGEIADHARIVRNEKLEYREIIREGRKMVNARQDAIEKWSAHKKQTGANETDIKNTADRAREDFTKDRSSQADLVRKIADIAKGQDYNAAEKFLADNVDKVDAKGRIVRKGIITPDYASVLLEMPLSRKKLVMLVDATKAVVATARIEEIRQKRSDKESMLKSKSVLLDRDLQAHDGSVFDALDDRDTRLSSAIVDAIDVPTAFDEAYDRKKELADNIWGEALDIEAERYRANDPYVTRDKVLPGADEAMIKMQRFEDRARSRGDLTLSTQMTDDEARGFTLGVMMVRESIQDSDSRKNVVGQILAENALRSVQARIRMLATAQNRDPKVVDHIVEQMSGKLRQMFTVKSKKSA